MQAVFAGLGAWVLTYGVVDLVWLATGDVERIWFNSKAQSIGIAIGLAVGGVVLLVLGLVRPSWT